MQNGPKQIASPSWAARERDSQKPPPTMVQSTTSKSTGQDENKVRRESPTPVSYSAVEEGKSRPNVGTNDTRSQPSSSSFDALQKAQAAIAAAKRASAAARLAADLVKLNCSSTNLEVSKE